MQKQMKKILTGATVGATVVATGLNVQAEEVVTTDVAQPTAVETTATSTTTIPSSAEIKPALDEAKSNVDELATVVADGEKTVAEQEKTLASAESKVVEAESSVATAKSELATAEERVVESTPENIENAKQNVATATESVSNKTEAVSNLETAKADAEADVTSKSTEVATAQSNVATQEQAVATAQTGVEKASQDVTTASQNLTSAKESATTLEGIVAEDTQAVANAKNAYDKAVSDQENKTQAIASAESTVTEKMSALESATNSLNSATYAKENAQSTVDSAQSAYDTALKGTTTTKEVTTYKEELVGAKVTATGANYTPKFTNATIQAIKGYQSGKITKEALRKVLESDHAIEVPYSAVGWDDPFGMNPTAELGMHQLITFLEVNDVDKTVYNVDTLPSDVLDDVALFAVAHINSMRAQVGKAPFELSTTSMGIARQVLDTFLTEDWKSGSVTPLTGLTAMQVRELTDDKYTSFVKDTTLEADVHLYENNSTTTFAPSQAISKEIRNFGEHRSITRAGLKFSVLNAITNPYTKAFYDLMTMDGKQIGIDTVRLAGGTPKRSQYTTWTFSVTDAEGTSKDNQYQTVTGGTIKKVPVTTTVTENVVDQDLVNSTKSALDTSKSELETAKSNLTTAQNAYNQAKTAYDSSVAYLNNLKSGVSNVEATKQALADAETKLAYDKARLVKAQELVETAKAELTAKKDALISSQEVVATEKSKLSDLQGVLTVKQSELQLAQGVVGKLSADVESAKGILSTAKNDLVSAQAYLGSLVNAQENLVKAQEKVALAERSLNEAVALRDIDKSALKTYKDLLVQTKEAYEKALAIYNPLKAEYDRRVELEEMSKTHDITILADGTVVAIPKVFPTVDALPVASIEDVLGTTTVKADEVTGVSTTDNQVTGTTVGATAQATSSKGETAKASVLPNTGTDSSMLGVLGMTGLISLAYASKRRRQN